MGIIASENFGYLLDPGLRKIFTDEYGMPDVMRETLYGTETSSKATEYDYAIGHLGDLEEFTGTIGYGDFSGQYRVSYTHREWVKGMKIERKLVDDDQYNIINRRPAGLALSAKRTMEKHAAGVFNSAFNTSTFTGGDTLSLCNASHTFVGTTTTQGNKGTASLSPASLASARLAMRGYMDDTDNLINARGDTLLVPPELEQKAFEMTKSQRIPYEQSNTESFIRSLNFKVLVWDYLTDTDNWFLIDGRFAKMFLKWFQRIPTEFNKDKDFDTYVSKWSVYTRYSYGFSSWQWIYGNAVS